ncbi:hypothetical protein BJ742DRAFT_843958 [Cladochytrium replicatum]|nr:hypothetical protein BJ742DRAFT_843958 [Cladochytrium replicatum]
MDIGAETQSTPASAHNCRPTSAPGSDFTIVLARAQALWAATSVEGNFDWEESSFRDLIKPIPVGDPHLVKPTEEAIELLKRYNTLRKTGFIKEDLHLVALSGSTPSYGKKCLEIREGVFRDIPVYVVDSFWEVTECAQTDENQGNIVCRRSLTAYVGPNFETYSQTIREERQVATESGPQGTTSVSEIITGEDGIVVGEKTTGAVETNWVVTFKTNKLTGFLFEGSMEVLARVLAQEKTQTDISGFVGVFPGGQVSRVALAVDERTFRVPHHRQPVHVFAVRQRAAVAHVLPVPAERNEDDEDDSWEETNKEEGMEVNKPTGVGSCPDYAESYFLGDGACLFSYRPEFPYICIGMEKEDPGDVETDILQSSDFGSNIELKSEYNMNKSEISKQQEEYCSSHPELQEILSDYVQLLLHRKPADVYTFTHEMFNFVGS